MAYLRLQHLEQQQGENVCEQKTTPYHEATTAHRRSPLVVVQGNLKHKCSRKAANGFEIILCRILVKRTPAGMDRSTDRRNITEIMLKTALDTLQLVNQSR